MRLQRIAAVAASLAFAGAAYAQDKPCSSAEMAKAEKAIDMTNNWTQLYKAWKDYAHCDKGNVSDVYTDAMLRLIVPWEKVKDFSDALDKDPEFRKFVYAKLKGPAAKDDRYTVYQRAKAQCPKGMDAFCNDLAEVVKDP
jgi:hypothetical protein